MAKKEAKEKTAQLYINFYENADGKGILTERGNFYICPYGKEDAVFIPKKIVQERNSAPKGKFIRGSEDFFNGKSVNGKPPFTLTKLGPKGPDGKRLEVPEDQRETITLAQLKESVDAQNAARTAEVKAKLDAAKEAAAEAEPAEAEAAEMDGPEA